MSGKEEELRSKHAPGGDGALNEINLYLAEIRQFPLLTPPEEVSLAKRIKRSVEAQRRLEVLSGNGLERSEIRQLRRERKDGQVARKTLANSNLRLVVSIAKGHRGNGLSFLDLIQEGNSGLMRAVDKFDWRLGYRFATYATWWIRQAIGRGLDEQARTIRVSVHEGERYRKIDKMRQRKLMERGEFPSDEEIEQALNLPRGAVRRALQVFAEPASFDKLVGKDKDSTLGEFIEDESISVEEETRQYLLKEDVAEILASLTPREQRIIKLRFGLEGGQPHTLEEIGEVFGFTRERARQIEAKVIRKLRHPAKFRKLRVYVEQ